MLIPDITGVQLAWRPVKVEFRPKQSTSHSKTQGFDHQIRPQAASGASDPNSGRFGFHRIGGLSFLYAAILDNAQQAGEPLRGGLPAGGNTKTCPGSAGSSTSRSGVVPGAS